MDEKSYFDFLKARILELIELPIQKDKIKPIENLICRYTSELEEKINEEKNPEKISLEFKHYVKNILSIIETLISGDQYKALRRLLQNEIYSCCTVVINNIKK